MCNAHVALVAEPSKTAPKLGRVEYSKKLTQLSKYGVAMLLFYVSRTYSRASSTQKSLLS